VGAAALVLLLVGGGAAFAVWPRGPEVAAPGDAARAAPTEQRDVPSPEDAAPEDAAPEDAAPEDAAPEPDRAAVAPASATQAPAPSTSSAPGRPPARRPWDPLSYR
jgi:hypothetical protein